MIIVDTALVQRAAEGRPIRVGLIGAGKFGSMYLAQVPRGLELVSSNAKRLSALVGRLLDLSKLARTALRCTAACGRCAFKATEYTPLAKTAGWVSIFGAAAIWSARRAVSSTATTSAPAFLY